MADDRDSAQALERKARARTRARLELARAEGRQVVEVELAPQGVVVKVEADRKAQKLAWVDLPEPRGRRRKYNRKAILADREEGLLTISEIARKHGCTTATVRYIQGKRRK